MIKKIIFVLFASILLVFSHNEANSSGIYGRPDAKGFFYVYGYNDYYGTLDLTPSMPFDIIMSYIYADSIAKSTPTHLDSVKKNVWSIGAYSDTMKYALKYLYKITDYDPVKYLRFRGKLHPNSFNFDIQDNYLKHRIGLGYPEESKAYP